jgi:hypothetical protein
MRPGTSGSARRLAGRGGSGHDHPDHHSVPDVRLACLPGAGTRVLTLRFNGDGQNLDLITLFSRL